MKVQLFIRSLVLQLYAITDYLIIQSEIDSCLIANK